VIERGDFEGHGVEGLQHDGSSSCVGVERVGVDGNETVTFARFLRNVSGCKNQIEKVVLSRGVATRLKVEHA
jgi:hypothetical protein